MAACSAALAVWKASEPEAAENGLLAFVGEFC